MKKGLLNMEEAVEYLNMPKPTLYKLVQQRKIKYSKPGGQKIYFRKEWLDNFIDKHAVDPVNEPTNAEIENMELGD